MNDFLRCRYCGGDPFEPDHESKCDGRQGGKDEPPPSPIPPVDPKKNVRSTDPDTSHSAAYEHKKTRVRDRDRALVALVESVKAPCNGLTDYELADQIHRQQNSAGKRRGELRDAGLVQDSGRRRDAPSGSSAIVWVPTPEGIALASLIRT